MVTARLPKLLGLGLALTLAASAPVWADAPQSGAGHGGQRFQQRLGLTDDQMAAIKAINARHADDHKQLMRSLRQAQQDLKQAALNGGDVKAKSAAIASIVGQMTELRATTLQEIAPLLTPEQRETMAKMTYRGHWHRGGAQS